MLVRKLRDNELYHHGVKGQRWGIRRYQNPDGSYTDEGYIHYGYVRPMGKTKAYESGTYWNNSSKVEQLIESDDRLKKKAQDLIDEYQNQNIVQLRMKNTKDRMSFVNEELKQLKVEDNDGEYVIKKGTKFQRITDREEDVGTKRKYLSFLSDDNDRYMEDRYDFGGNTPHKETYESTNDIRVAKSDAVYNELIKKVGDKKVSDYKLTPDEVRVDVDKYANTKVKDLLNKAGDDNLELWKTGYKKGENTIEDIMVSQYAHDVIDDGRTIANKILQKELYKNTKTQDEIVKTLSKKGYDAMIDIEDAYAYADLPIILFNPKNNTKKIKSEKLYSIAYN